MAQLFLSCRITPKCALALGYSTAQEFLYLREKGIKFKPDIVLLLFCENDFGNNVRGEEYRHFKPYFAIDNGQLALRNSPVPEASLGQRFDCFFAERTYLGSKLLGPGNVSAIDQQEAVKVTSQIIDEIRSLCGRNNSELVIISDRLPPGEQTALRTIADEQEIRYLPLGGLFESSAVPMRFTHDHHWNAAGHTIVADALNGFLWGPD